MIKKVIKRRSRALAGVVIITACQLSLFTTSIASETTIVSKKKFTQQKICRSLLTPPISKSDHDVSWSLKRNSKELEVQITKNPDPDIISLEARYRKFFAKCFRAAPNEKAQIGISMVFSSEASNELKLVEYDAKDQTDVARAFAANLNDLFDVQGIDIRTSIIDTGHYTITNSDKVGNKDLDYGVLLDNFILRPSNHQRFTSLTTNPLTDFTILLVGSNKEKDPGDCGRSYAAIDYLHEVYGEVDPFNSIAIVNLKCICSQNTLAHEIGHMMGLDHANPKHPPQHHIYRKGYFIKGLEWKSLMSDVKDCPNCRRGNFWSDPKFRFQYTGTRCKGTNKVGCALGTNESNNAAKHIKKTAICAASLGQFREFACGPKGFRADKEEACSIYPTF